MNFKEFRQLREQSYKATSLAGHALEMSKEGDCIADLESIYKHMNKALDIIDYLGEQYTYLDSDLNYTTTKKELNK